MNEIVVWKNYFLDEERKTLKKECDKYHWELTGWSQQLPETRYFWMKNLIDSVIIQTLFKIKIENYLHKNIEVLRVYANGQAHGQCGMFHTDTPETSDDSYYSLVYYIHEDWKYEYGGHLLIKNANGCEFYWPETNSAILFNSKMQHCPLEPTIFCKLQRESIAFKFRIL